MKIGKMAAIPVVACALSASYAVWSHTRCGPLTDLAKTRLIGYVAKKYNLPLAATLRVTEAPVVGSTCYRKLDFWTDGPGRPFRISLFATPDLRYLTRELLDPSGNSVNGPVEKQRPLANISVGDFPAIGASDAAVTITVFSDFECPYCARFATMMRKDVLPAEGQHVRFVFRQFPLKMHPWARMAAEASACAYRQKNDYFWSFHDFFFEHQAELNPNNLTGRIIDHASSISGLDRPKFEACLSGSETATTIERDMRFGEENGIRGTPTIFLNGKQARAGDAGQLLSLIKRLEADPNAAILSPESTPAANNRRQPRDIPDVARGDFPALGPADAPVTLTVFSDFQCPYCERFARLMRKEVLPAERKVRLVFRNFPLSMHAWARASAEAAACAYQQKNAYFWDFHDFFFEHQRDLTATNVRQQIIEHAHKVVGLDQEKFRRCVEQESTKDLVDRDVAFGNTNSIEGTPTVFMNGKPTEIVTREQVFTLVRELTSNPNLVAPSPAASDRLPQ